MQVDFGYTVGYDIVMRVELVTLEKVFQRFNQINLSILQIDLALGQVVVREPQVLQQSLLPKDMFFVLEVVQFGV